MRTPLLSGLMAVCILLLGACTGNGGEDRRADGASATHAKPGFAVYERDGRLWVFHEDSEHEATFLAVGEPAKSVTMIGVGPGGKSIRAIDKDVVVAYLAAKPGYHTEVKNGRVWVFREGSEDHDRYLAEGEPGKCYTAIGVGPLGATVRSESKDHVAGWLTAKPGYHTELVDGRVWILEEGSEAHQEFAANGEIGKNYTSIGTGPMGMSLRSDSRETVYAWAATEPGFNTYIVDGRIWVFEPGSEAEAEFKANGEPAKSVTFVGAGPLGMTVRGAERATVVSYIAASAS